MGTATRRAVVEGPVFAAANSHSRNVLEQNENYKAFHELECGRDRLLGLGNETPVLLGFYWLGSNHAGATIHRPTLPAHEGAKVTRNSASP